MDGLHERFSIHRLNFRGKFFIGFGGKEFGAKRRGKGHQKVKGFLGKWGLGYDVVKEIVKGVFFFEKDLTTEVWVCVYVWF